MTSEARKQKMKMFQVPQVPINNKPMAYLELLQTFKSFGKDINEIFLIIERQSLTPNCLITNA